VHEQPAGVGALDEIAGGDQTAVGLVDLPVGVLVADDTVAADVRRLRAADVGLPGADAIGVAAHLVEAGIRREERERARQQLPGVPTPSSRRAGRTAR